MNKSARECMDNLASLLPFFAESIDTVNKSILESKDRHAVLTKNEALQLTSLANSIKTLLDSQIVTQPNSTIASTANGVTTKIDRLFIGDNVFLSMSCLFSHESLQTLSKEASDIVRRVSLVAEVVRKSNETVIFQLQCLNFYICLSAQRITLFEHSIQFNAPRHKTVLYPQDLMKLQMSPILADQEQFDLICALCTNSVWYMKSKDDQHQQLKPHHNRLYRPTVSATSLFHNPPPVNPHNNSHVNYIPNYCHNNSNSELRLNENDSVTRNNVQYHSVVTYNKTSSHITGTTTASTLPVTRDFDEHGDEVGANAVTWTIDRRGDTSSGSNVDSKNGNNSVMGVAAEDRVGENKKRKVNLG